MLWDWWETTCDFYQRFLKAVIVMRAMRILQCLRQQEALLLNDKVVKRNHNLRLVLVSQILLLVRIRQINQFCYMLSYSIQKKLSKCFIQINSSFFLSEDYSILQQVRLFFSPFRFSLYIFTFIFLIIFITYCLVDISFSSLLFFILNFSKFSSKSRVG